MSTERPLFSRPIAVTSANDSVGVTVNAVAYNVTLTNGVYPCVRRLAYNLDTKLTAAIGSWTVAFNATTYKMTLTYTGANAWTAVTWTDTTLRDLLGYTGSEAIGGGAGAYTLVATHRPSTTWFPTFQPADQGAWQIMGEDIFTGVSARNGRNVGFQSGPLLYSRSFDFVHEEADRVYCEFAGDAYEYERALERFIMLSRTTSNNSGDVSAKGFYVYHDMADALTTASSTLDDGGITWQYSSGAETYVYCHPEPQGVIGGAASMPVSRGRYSITGLRIHTATAPTWSAP